MAPVLSTPSTMGSEIRASFETIPPELRNSIVHLLDATSRSVLTKVSKGFRNRYLGLVFQKLKVYGSVYSVYRQLIALARNEEFDKLPDGRKLVRGASFVVAETESAGDSPVYVELVRSLIECARALSHAETMGINLEWANFVPTYELMTLIDSRPLWESILLLSIDAPRTVAACCIRACDPSVLTSLSLAVDEVSSTAYRAVASHLPNLKNLRLCVSSSEEEDKVGAFRPDLLETVSNDFEELEYLVLEDAADWHGVPEKMWDFSDSMVESLEILPRFKSLKRLSFSMREKQMVMDIIVAIGFAHTDEQAAEHHRLMLKRVARAHPQLEKISMRGKNHVIYAITRAENGQFEMAEEECFAFP